MAMQSSQPATLGDASAFPDPVEVMNNLWVPANTLVSIFSTHGPLQVYLGLEKPMVIYAPIPTVICYPYPIKITSSIPLDLRFVHGWNKLPNELQLWIFSYLELESEHNILWGNDEKEGSGPATENLRSYLAISLKFARLAMETFYRNNTFEIGMEAYITFDDEQIGHDEVLLHFPKPEVNSFIQRIELCVDLDDEGMAILYRFAKGIFGFDNLKWVTVVASMVLIPNENNRSRLADGWEAEVERLCAHRVEFRCEGEVQVYLQHEKQPLRTVRSMVALVQSKFVFGLGKTSSWALSG